jgi:hypothetical protein
MTDPVLVALIVGGCGAIPAVLSWMTSRRSLQVSEANSAKSVAIASKADTLAVKADTIIEKATEIHTATNGHLSELRDQLGTAMERIAGLERLIKSKDSAAAATAQVAEAATIRSEARESAAKIANKETPT